MSTAQGPVVYPAVSSKQGVHSVPISAGPSINAKIHRSSLWGSKVISFPRVSVGKQLISRTVRCTYSSSSNGNGSMAENFSNDSDYVNSSVLDAVEIKSSSDCFMIKMRDGKHLRCVHNTPQEGGHAPGPANPAIVLKMEDGTGLLLPIVVLEMPRTLLMAAMCNVQIARPTMYELVRDMIDKTGYMVKLVRVTKKIGNAYYAQLILSKVDDKTECVSFELRPSDAINIAVRCKVPIHVNKLLAYTDGMRVMESAKVSREGSSSEGLLFRELDRPTGQPCIESKEFDFVRNMLIAAVEERYRDAAQWKDKLAKLRSQEN